MVELKRTRLSVRREQALLLGVMLPADKHRAAKPLAELASLARTAGARVVGEVVQQLKRFHPSTWIGRGKAQEVHDRAKSLDADVVICDGDLSPAQVRNLEKITDTKVVDRSELILDIFATHARTKQARLQVELAQLEYTYPRLARMWTHLSRYEGGIGTRGPGEMQLETDRRLVQRRIRDLKRELGRIDARRQREVKSRGECFKVGIVGYTNAGKSTLMNALTDAGVRVEDQLFATLDTKTRRWDLGDHGEALLSDTVGFIRHLPHHLVASFKATLEEATLADLLLHIVDISRADAIEQAEAVMEVLEEIGCRDKRIVTVFNKVDAADDETALHILSERFRNGVTVSALKKQGLDRLTEAVVAELQRDFAELVVTFPSSDGRLAAFLFEKGDVLERDDQDTVTQMRVKLHRRFLADLSEHDGVEVRVSDGKEEPRAERY